MDLLNTLVQKDYIHEEELGPIREELEAGDQSLEDILDKRGVKPTDLAKVRSQELDLPLAEIQPEAINKKVLRYITQESARHYQIVPLRLTDGYLEVGAVEPERSELSHVLNFISTMVGRPCRLVVIDRPTFDKLMEMYQGLSGEVKEALTELEKEFAIERGGGAGDEETPEVEKKVAEGEVKKSDSDDQTKIVADAPVTKIVATILRYATDGGASDVHIEPLKDMVRVRFRVDGVLNTSLQLPGKVRSAVAARIKILSNMKLDEKRKPQDGRFSATIEKRKIDFRTSTFPTYYGEKLVMRILDQEKGIKNLEELGLREVIVNQLKEAITRPYGFIVISGPTGSGKTTTLYALLQELDKEKKNILSLEDPIEYNIEGISQSQIRSDIGYSFSNGLRTTLRQDPDIIMVGEIRDKETAKLAIQAALTGHLVLSTLHTNNAIGVIPRLVDMGVEPYLIAPTLILAVAQRLVHRLCPDAKNPIPVEGGIREMFEREIADLPEEYRREIEIPDTVYEPGSSSQCPTGVKGRLAVTETLPMDNDLEALILKDPNENKIAELARSKGMLSMKEDAMLKAFRGEVPFAEVGGL